MTLNQFSLPLGTAARRRGHGMASAISAFAHGQIRTAIRLVACRMPEFTSEHVLQELSGSTRSQLLLHPNALGAAIRAAAVENLIEPTGRYVSATRAEARGRKIGLWQLRRMPRG